MRRLAGFFLAAMAAFASASPALSVATLIECHNVGVVGVNLLVVGGFRRAIAVGMDHQQRSERCLDRLRFVFRCSNDAGYLAVRAGTSVVLNSGTGTYLAAISGTGLTTTLQLAIGSGVPALGDAAGTIGTQADSYQSSPTATGSLMAFTKGILYELGQPAVLSSSAANIGVVGVAQGATTSGQYGPLAQGAVSTSAPGYTTAQTSPLSLTTTGSLRVQDASSSATGLNRSSQALSGRQWKRNSDGHSTGRHDR